MRTSAPCLPSGRRFASTSHSGGSISMLEIPRIVCTASRVAMSTTRDSPSASSVGIVRAGDEDHVDVADVVQLAGAGLAHADDGELRGGHLVAREQPGTRRAPSEMRVRATQRDASSAAPAASASRAATAATTSTGEALSRSYAAIRARSLR